MPGKFDEWQTINKLQHCLWLSHQAWLHIKMLQCWRKAAWPPQHLFYINSSEKENSSFKNYCKGKKPTYCIYLKPSRIGNTLRRKKSFLYDMILDTNFCVRIFFPIHPYLQWYLLRPKQAVMPACYSFLWHPTGASPLTWRSSWTVQLNLWLVRINVTEK